MSEFTYLCPVCRQHIKCATTLAGTVMKCPTCYQRIVAPQAPSAADGKLLFTGHKYVEKKAAGGSAPAVNPAPVAPQKAFPTALVLAVLGG
jgi:hypothetical protein